MPVKKLKEFLDENKVKYMSISHSPAFTSLEIAASAHIPGQTMAKTVVLKVDGKMALAVLPSAHKVDFNLLKTAIGANNLELASEQEFAGLFPQCEVGAMPPFGNLYGMEVFVAESLAENDEIAFNAGSHTELIKMLFKDFESLVKPRRVKFAATN